MTTTKPTTLWSDIDFARDGKQVDWLYLPHSVTRSAYGEIMIPIAVVKRGPGPTLGYYHAILDPVRVKLGAHPIVAELEDALAELEQAAGD